MSILGYWFKRNLRWIVADVLCLAMMVIIISLNRVPLSEWFYGAMLCLFVLVLIGGSDFVCYYNRHKRLVKLQQVIQISLDSLEIPQDQLEDDYQQLIRLVHEDKVREINDSENQKTDMKEYYTMWVHQIKTPIAAMRLLLQSQPQDDPQNQELSEELFRIEQYVEMALQYLRLDFDTTDFVIRRYELDDLVKEAVRKYARLFIRKKISLKFEPLETRVLTDEKWLVFVIEQILSNAIKYTTGGSVSIYMKDKNSKVLVIEDTGIGIRAEDLPRVCENGYTGYNGHTDKRSTGIGLYLCRRILRKLSHDISIESEVGKGTKVYINLNMEERVHE